MRFRRNSLSSFSLRTGNLVCLGAMVVAWAIELLNRHVFGGYEREVAITLAIVSCFYLAWQLERQEAR